MSFLKENFLKSVSTYDTKKEVRQSSLIAPWLGIERTPPGFSQRFGNYIEDFFALDLGNQNKLMLADYKNGRNFMITYNGKNHQLDMLAMPCGWEEWEKIIHREIKTNTDIDAGKKRDTLFREGQIRKWIEKKGWAYDSGIFCPFFYDKGRRVSGLGWVDGLQWYIDTFNPNWTIQDFIDLGRDIDVHRSLGLID